MVGTQVVCHMCTKMFATKSAKIAGTTNYPFFEQWMKAGRITVRPTAYRRLFG